LCFNWEYTNWRSRIWFILYYITCCSFYRIYYSLMDSNTWPCLYWGQRLYRKCLNDLQSLTRDFQWMANNGPMMFSYQEGLADWSTKGMVCIGISKNWMIFANHKCPFKFSNAVQVVLAVLDQGQETLWTQKGWQLSYFCFTTWNFEKRLKPFLAFRQFNGQVW